MTDKQKVYAKRIGTGAIVMMVYYATQLLISYNGTKMGMADWRKEMQFRLEQSVPRTELQDTAKNIRHSDSLFFYTNNR